MNETENKLKGLLLSYSLDDLTRSFFALDLWLQNIASPIKIEYLYSVLEAVAKDLSIKNQIKSYKDFETFCKKLFKLIPSFQMMEDYIPEMDWGEIKYYFDNRFYKVFYGSNLDNAYDFYYAFEIIHGGLEKEYAKVIQRSPLKELEFCLSVQDYIINNVNQATQPKPEVNAGYFDVSSEEFWVEANQFLTEFVPEKIFNNDMLVKYSYDISTIENKPWPTVDDFSNRAMEGKNCLYFFIKAGEKHYPVMPRRIFSVLYDTWGLFLKQHYTKIQHENPKISIEIQLSKFILERSSKEETTGFVSAVYPDKKPQAITFAAAIRSKNNLFLIHVAPPLINKSDLNGYLEKLTLDLKESEKLLSVYPTRLRAWLTEYIIEFHHKKDDCALKPIFFTVIPYCTTEMVSLGVPKDLPGIVIGLDQLAGIIDELEDPDELADFFEYIENLHSSFVFPLTSYLDQFGSFKDSHSVIIPGASKPDFLVLDSHWGTDFRFRSLSDFWRSFPEVNFFGHPRSWMFPKKGEGKVLKSKIFKGYAYHQTIVSAVFFINSPIDLMSYEQSKITDLMMHSLADALYLYQNIISKLILTNRKNRIQVLFVPASLVESNTDLKHLKHLVPKANIWSMDVSLIGAQDLGVRVVFDDKRIVDALIDAKDRSPQIDLLISVLRQINTVWVDRGLQHIEEKLFAERSQRNRFAIFSVEKEVSFPEDVITTLPEEKDFKLADKTIAQLADELGIIPGKYRQEQAKEKINQLINGLVNKINCVVSAFDFTQAIPLLIEKTDALVFEDEMNKYQVKESLDREVDYEREDSLSEDHQKFLNNHRDYKYIIEKFVQLSPNREKEFAVSELRNLLALVNRLINMYTISDIFHYGIYPAELEIHHDYLSSVTYSADVSRMQKEYGKEQAQIDLGIIGNKNDILNGRIPVESYLDTLDKAFREDLGFGYRSFINIQQLMSLWAVYRKISESACYIATEDEIAKIGLENIRDFNADETGKILNFLTLKSEDMLKIVGDMKSAGDLPVWEYRKRIARYNIKPLLKINDKYMWGPYSVYRSARTWITTSSTYRLSVDIDAPTISSVLKKGHEDIEESLVDKGIEIVKRFTKLVKANVYLHKLDASISNIGDCDILAYLLDKNILLNIESKIIDTAYCPKDMQRIQRKIFGRKRRNGSFDEGYLQKVERRDTYLKNKSLDIIKKVGWQNTTELPKVVSIFLIKTGFWWTRFPTVDTEVKFTEIRLLDYFIKNLV